MSSPTESKATDDPVFGEPLIYGDWCVRQTGPADYPALFALRALAFRKDASATDEDRHDAQSIHLWVGRSEGQGPTATIRLRLHQTPDEVRAGYAAQFYDLGALSKAGLPVLELGRLCRAPTTSAPDADVLRLLWAGVARVALRTQATRLMGCTSFPTTDPAALAPALALLALRYLPPKALRPGPKAAEIFRFATADIAPPEMQPDPSAAALLPPLLRAYLALGGWVSDHLVIDRDLGTSHVFTCVDIASMPAARKRVLTQMAAG